MWFYYLLAIIIILVSAALVFFVVIQKSKGGGLATNLGGASAIAQQMGTRRGTDFVEKATWYSIGIIAVLSIAANVALMSGLQSEGQSGGLRSAEAVSQGGAVSSPVPSGMMTPTTTTDDAQQAPPAQDDGAPAPEPADGQ